MRMEETLWDVYVGRDVSDRNHERLRDVLTRAIEKRLDGTKELLRVVAWSPNAGGLFEPKAGPRRYAVSYEVRWSA
ncbi:hypothetical protein MMAD_24330 [Mycolicibacterium madagascariense]|uniref:Uncharacterized protein n=2 Tax=Mycolicibacterium madagascariense TaxID=212765 RepID=A0A7I7XG20_9MYCO|nr:hypothetical protein MMAD_24330 [Mycolicibacterium madagascariense]